MRIEAPIFFLLKKKILKDSPFLRLYELVHKCTSPPAEHLPCVELLRMQSGTTPLFRALRVGRRVHQSTCRTPPTRGQFMYASQNNSLFLGLCKFVDECTSPPFKHLPRVDNPRLCGGRGPGGGEEGFTNERL